MTPGGAWTLSSRKRGQCGCCGTDSAHVPSPPASLGQREVGTAENRQRNPLSSVGSSKKRFLHAAFLEGASSLSGPRGCPIPKFLCSF